MRNFVDLILVNSGPARVLLAPSYASVVIKVPNLISRTNRFSIAIWSCLD
jgi:hypothetical protein